MPVIIDYLAITPPLFLESVTIFLCTPARASLSLSTSRDGLAISRQTSTLLDVQ